jgi:hypothetical protein
MSCRWGAVAAFASAVCCLLVALTPVASAREEASIAFDEAVAVYGPGIFPAITKLVTCGDYRVFVVYGNGTDMLFADKIVPASNESTYAAEDGISFAEFNFYEQSVSIRKVSCKLLGPTKYRVVGKVVSGHADRSFGFTIVVDAAARTYTYKDTLRK